MLKTLHPLSLAALILALACIIAISVLAGLKLNVPSELPDALFATLGIGGVGGTLTSPNKASSTNNSSAASTVSRSN